MGLPLLSRKLEDRIEALTADGSADILAGGLKGVEKESLRVTPDGLLSRTPHPPALGSALTNKFITTDFSEALLEFVTPATPHTWELLRTLCEIHQFTYGGIDDELLWMASMPCLMSDDREIPLARYGESNVGRMKTIYRRGLGYRYGRKMQTIAGVHFNYSLPTSFWPQYQELEQDAGDADDFRSSAYLGLVRNFRRYGWLILYLFGASPALCKSFAGRDDLGMPSLDADTLYEPFGTSLRMSDLGYSNRTQSRINISLNTLDEYIHDLNCAISSPEPEFEKIGVKIDGEYRQLSVNQLQIENEYYSAIRPKRVAFSGERPTAALRRGGIEYVEIRSLDLNVFDPVGINQNAMRFIEAFLIYCLLEESAPLDGAGLRNAAYNHAGTARHGRDPAFRLARDGREIALVEWGNEIMRGVGAIAEIIDRAGDDSDYADAVAAQAVLLDDADATPSARLLQELEEQGSGFFRYALANAKGHKEYFAEIAPLERDRLALYEEEAAASLRRQAEIEAADSISLEEYLEKYFAAV